MNARIPSILHRIWWAIEDKTTPRFRIYAVCALLFCAVLAVVL